MPVVCGVSFRTNSKVYHFAVNKELELQVDDYVIVDTARGQELGRVMQAPRDMEPREVVGDLKPVLRLATTAELLEAERLRLREDEAVALCRERVAAANLPMKVVSGEYSFDGSHLTFYFASEERVDFRNLVRDLARVFKTRIELRQLGVRDEARMVGGVGKCGRPLCCATWLDSFAPVSIRMAKQQNLPLSPNEISGLCGRLLCCLNYEYDYYKEVAGRFPKVGKIVESPLGPARVTYVSVLRERVELLLEDGTRAEMTAEQFRGEEPFEQAEPERKTQQLAETLNHISASSGRKPEPQQAAQPRGPEPAAGGGRPGRPQQAAPGRRGDQATRNAGAESPGAEAGAAESPRRRRRPSGGRRRSRRRSASSDPEGAA